MAYKGEKQWDYWQRSTVELACAQGVEAVLDINYVPTNTSDDVVLFEEKKKFMYAVFECTLQTDLGKAFVCEWEATYDSQLFYAAYLTTLSSLQKHPWTQESFYYILHLQRLGMEIGKVLLSHSFYHGKITSACIISLLNQVNNCLTPKR
jgi:hypothetical protein